MEHIAPCPFYIFQMNLCLFVILNLIHISFTNTTVNHKSQNNKLNKTKQSQTNVELEPYVV